ncbi:hypothetical protein WA158_003137 [Blastocystis sp. Blastoise]
MVKEGVLLDLDSINQLKDIASGFDELMKKVVDGFTSIVSETLYTGKAYHDVLKNLNNNNNANEEDKNLNCKQFQNEKNNNVNEAMNMSKRYYNNAVDTDLIRFSSDGPVFSISKSILNSIQYSYIYEQSEEEMRTKDGTIFLDYRGNDIYVYYLLDYLNGKEVDYSVFDIKDKLELLHLYEFCNIIIPVELVGCREKRDDNKRKYKEGDEVSLFINGKKEDVIKQYLIKNEIWNAFVMKYNDGFVDYNFIDNSFSMSLKCDTIKYITQYAEHEFCHIVETVNNDLNINLLKTEMYTLFGDKGRQCIIDMMKRPTVFLESKIINKKCFETSLVNWLGKQKKWKLLFRASDHNFKASEFHKYCDTKCPTVTIIKHIGHDDKINIFGGYTDQNWESRTENCWKYDSGSFLFTLSNEHDIPPTKYDILDPFNALYCDMNSGPCFLDISIEEDCHNNKNSYINGKTGAYSHSLTPQFRSLFVNTAGPQEQNNFCVDEYEVYELIPNPDLYLPNSILINEEMGNELTKWFKGNKKWELLYRCSDEKRSIKKWHEKCDDKESLVIIQGKGKDGQSYIFGGYTSVGWGKNHNDMENPLRKGTGFRADPKAFLFSLTNPHGHNYTKLNFNPKKLNSALVSNDSSFELTFCYGIYLCTQIDKDRFTNGSNEFLYNEDPVYISPYPELGNSFFVNTNKPGERNIFDLIDFEVFTS